MYKYNGKTLDLKKVEDNKYYFMDVYTQEDLILSEKQFNECEQVGSSILNPVDSRKEIIMTKNEIRRV